MTSPPPRSPVQPLAMLAGAAVLLVAGVGLGLFLAESWREERASPLYGPAVPTDARLLAAMEALGSDVAALRQGALLSPLSRLPAEAWPTAPVGGSLALPVLSADPPVALRSQAEDEDTFLVQEILDQLVLQLEHLSERQETIMGLLLVSGQGEVQPGLPLPPPGMPIRTYLGAIKQFADQVGSDVVTRSHMLWDTGQVVAAYGQPDEVNDHESYVEWVYLLPEQDDQFDFHFVNGLVVLSH